MNPGDLDGLADEDQKKLLGMIENMQTRDSLRMYNGLVERCFIQCVDSFRRKTLEKNEEACVVKCTEKFLKHSARVSLRFQELNQEAMVRGERPPPSPYLSSCEDASAVF